MGGKIKLFVKTYPKTSKNHLSVTSDRVKIAKNIMFAIEIQRKPVKVSLTEQKTIENRPKLTKTAQNKPSQERLILRGFREKG